jgi:hypothetical protein
VEVLLEGRFEHAAKPVEGEAEISHVQLYRPARLRRLPRSKLTSPASRSSVKAPERRSLETTPQEHVSTGSVPVPPLDVPPVPGDAPPALDVPPVVALCPPLVVVPPLVDWPPLDALPLGTPPVARPPLDAPPLGTPPVARPPVAAPPAPVPPVPAGGSWSRPQNRTTSGQKPCPVRSCAAAPVETSNITTADESL